jgi:beta-lactamase class A
MFMAASAAFGAPHIPVSVPDEQWQPLSQSRDAALQAELNKYIASSPRLARLSKDGRLSVALVDLSNPSSPRYAAINGRKTVYAASMPKIAILLTAYDQISRGLLEVTKEVEIDMNAMIRNSSNGAATRMIDRVGGLDAINITLADPRYGLYDPENGGGLWVGKRYAKTGRRVTDPVAGVSHGASAFQTARYYYLLATGRLVDEATSYNMLQALADPGIRHKFVASLGQLAPDADLYRKSGTWRDYHADSVIVWGEEPWRRYILVGIVQSDAGGDILKDLIPAVETILHPEN